MCPCSPVVGSRPVAAVQGAKLLTHSHTDDTASGAKRGSVYCSERLCITGRPLHLLSHAAQNLVVSTSWVLYCPWCFNVSSHFLHHILFWLFPLLFWRWFLVSLSVVSLPVFVWSVCLLCPEVLHLCLLCPVLPNLHLSAACPPSCSPPASSSQTGSVCIWILCPVLWAFSYVLSDVLFHKYFHHTLYYDK